MTSGYHVTEHLDVACVRGETATAVREAPRRTVRRDALLATPALSHSTLAKLRGQEVSSSRAWFYRQQVKGHLFAVPHKGHAFIPAFQLTGAGDVRAELTAVIAPLREAGFDGWAIWQWLSSPTAWLSGETPESVAVNDPCRAVTAARRFAATPVA